MKFATMIMLSLVISTQAFAGCYEVYSGKLEETKELIESIKPERNLESEMFGNVISTTGMLTASAAVGGGTLLFTTSATAVGIASLYIEGFYINFRTDRKIKKAQELKLTLENALTVLKEAQIGRGPLLQRAMGTVHNVVSTDISLQDLADTIKSQDSSNLYCQSDDKILSADGIIKSAMDELAQR